MTTSPDSEHPAGFETPQSSSDPQTPSSPEAQQAQLPAEPVADANTPQQYVPQQYTPPTQQQESPQSVEFAGATEPRQQAEFSQPTNIPQPAEFTGATQPLPNYSPASSTQQFGYVTPQSQQSAPTYATHSAPTANAHPQTKQSSGGRGGPLIAGIAIGALLGALVGGGTAALVGSNMQSESSSTSQSPSGTITLNKTDEVSTISAVAAVATPSVVTIEVASTEASGSGSGVIYTDDGYIITNSHVATLEGAAGADAIIRVRLSDGRVVDGTLVGSDPYADIAVIKIEADDLTPIEIGDSESINVGDMSVVIGAPLNLANTVTSGVVSALNRGISVGTANLPDNGGGSEQQPDQDGDGDTNEDSPWGFDFESPFRDRAPQPSQTATATVTLPVIQTDASINPGNSGGALLNANAELIGINVAIASNGDASNAGSDGLGFAIPASYATRVADAIIAGEQPSHGLFGASVGDSSQDTDEDANRAGALLMDITAGGAADKAGFKVGDVVTAIDGIPVDSGTSISALVRMQEGGSTVTMTYTRGGEPGEKEVTLDTLTW